MGVGVSDYVREELEYIAERLVGVDSSLKMDSRALHKLFDEQGSEQAQDLAQELDTIRHTIVSLAMDCRTVAWGAPRIGR